MTGDYAAEAADYDIRYMTGGIAFYSVRCVPRAAGLLRT